MSSSREALRRQRRRELDARRSKSRVRLGACLQSWGQLKERLGFALHSELAQHLLESYFSKVCVTCTGSGREGKGAEIIVTSAESLQDLVLLVHDHGQHCPFPPTLQPGAGHEGQPAGGEQAGAEAEGWSEGGEGAQRQGKTDRRLEPGAQGCSGFTGEALGLRSRRKAKGEPDDGLEAELHLRYICQGGHLFSWCPTQKWREEVKEKGGGEEGSEKTDAAPAAANLPKERARRGMKEMKRERDKEEGCVPVMTRRHSETGPTVTTEKSGQPEKEGEGEDEEAIIDLTTETGENKATGVLSAQEEASETGSDQMPAEPSQLQDDWQLPEEDEREAEDPDTLTDKNNGSSPKSNSTAVPHKATRGKQRKTIQSGTVRGKARIVKRDHNRRTPKGLPDDDIAQIGGKRKRKATPRDILPCEFDGCGKIFSSRQYLNHHMKYQHVQQKTFACPHPSCGKSFNFKKHLKEHEKLHSNQRDYICEFCARAFRTSSNLIIHRRIHTGEKPLQCEVCGFTCRQKASLNWHMRKHDAESSYQFPCEICGRRFEKRDNVTAHRSKSHPVQAASGSSTADQSTPASSSTATGSPTPASDHPAHSGDLTGQAADGSDLSIVVM